MVTIFVVLGIVLLAVPITVVTFVVFSKIKHRKQTEMIKKATTTRTTVQKGPNGRTVFETTTTRPSPQQQSRKQSPPRSPILPYTQQQANKAFKSESAKNAWRRLSRPFSINPKSRAEEDQIELTQKLEPEQIQPTCEQRAKNPYAAPISPLSPNALHASTSSSTWNTIEDANTDPVSPVSMTNVNNSSSITGTVLQGYQRQTIFPSQSHQALDQQLKTIFHNVALTPPAQDRSTKHKTQRPPRGLDLGAARGFMPAKDVPGQNRHPADVAPIKQSIVDASRPKINKVQLSQPPKAKTAGKREHMYGGFI